jgi:2-C-methyl-D-erythritol 2,4-cyclodiphosphate synthase
VGFGTDIHRLAPGRPFILGGTTIDAPRGPVGHSDGDALLHAVCDALLGAAGLGDIGTHFPDSDESWAGVASHRLVEHVLAMVKDAGWTVVNLDAVVDLERPRLAPHRPEIERRLAGWLEVDPAVVNVKAKTGEGLGAIGSGEAVRASCVCLLESVDGRGSRGDEPAAPAPTGTAPSGPCR